MSGLVEVARYDHRVEADLARLYLESEGVEAILFDTQINGCFCGLFMPVRVMVLEEDFDVARKLLEDDQFSRWAIGLGSKPALTSAV